MSIYGSAVKKPITTLMIFLAIVVFGIYSFINLPVDLYPEIEFPAITVFTSYPGANAADIETNVTKPIEDALNSVDELKELTSVSRDNISIITLEFEYETDLSEAANDIRDALSLVEDELPEDAEKPNIFKFSSSLMPIMVFAITADENYEGLEKILDEKIISPLNRIDGMGSVNIVGAPKREIAIEVNPRKLEAHNMTVEQIGNILKAENINMPTGNVEMGRMNYPLRVEGEFNSSDFIKNIVVANYNGQAVYLKDIATVKDSLKEATMDERVNGELGVRMLVRKQSGANSVRIAKEVDQKLKKLRKNIPEDIQIETIFDTSDFINHSISNLTKTLLFALLFVTLVVLFFLGRWRATFIVIITIPISLIVSFIFLHLSGNSINIISLSALSIAIGMVVDDAIVVLENISKHIDRGSSPRESAIYATNEVWLAVIVTTLTVVAVFFPMTMLTGMTGVMFRQLGWIVTITVTTSTLAAITLTPMLTSKLLRRKKKQQKGFSFDKVILPVFDRLDNWYGRALDWCLHNKLLVTLISVFIFIFSLVMAGNLGTEFMPQTDEGRISITAELQSGTRVDESVAVARKCDSILMNEYPQIDLISTSAGADDEGSFISLFRSTGSHIINYTLRLVDLDKREQSVWEIAEQVRKDLDAIPEIITYNVSTEGGASMMGGNTVDVEIFGYDIDKTTLLANELKDKIEKIKGARDVIISREEEKPELQVILDRDKMASLGLNTAMVSSALYNRVEGMTTTKYREAGDEYDIIVRFKEKYRDAISDIENIALQTPSGKMTHLGEIAGIKEYWAPPNIERKRRERVVTVSVSPYKTSLGELANNIQSVIQNTNVPREMLIEVGGAYEDQQEGFTDLLMLLLLSLLLVYIVMASQFESFRMPFIIMFSIPFAFSGVIFALLITNTTLSVIAGLGAVMLIGIVVKNAIVLIDYINLMRDRGYKLDEAIVISGKLRLRPVLMTALTTILGMLPLALSTGEGSEIWSPMGISVIGGLLFSTLITMVIVPIMYRALAKRGERKAAKRNTDIYNFMEE